MAADKLFNEFPPVSTKDWTDQIIKDLKGADFEKKLVWETQEGFKVQPFYRKENLQGLEWSVTNLPGIFPFARSTRKLTNEWNIRQDIDSIDLKLAKELALEAVSNGVNSIGFVIQNSTSGRRGIPVEKKEDLEFLLTELPLNDITVHFIAEERSPQIHTWLPKVKPLIGGLGYDPFRILARHGRSGGHTPETLKPILEEYAATWPNYRSLTVHSSTFRDSGSTIVQELAFTLALGSEYLFRLSQTGLKPETVNSQTILQFTVGPDYFLEIAKFRAARTLWAEIFKAYSSETGEASLPFIAAETAKYNYGVYDVHNNMLRATTEAMTAAIGGAEIITVLPFDHLIQPADSFSLRIARNVQLLMKHESYLDKVVDPSSGSYYLETLTQSMTEQAWKLFCEIEKEGGFLSSLQTGKIQTRIAESRKKKEENYSTRKEIFLGTNQYPNLKDKITDKLLNKSVPTQPLETKPGESTCLAIPDFFAGGEIEEIRFLTENWEQKTGKPVKVLLIPVGDLKMKKARAIFSLNFLGCGGFAVIDPGSYENSAEAKSAIAKEQPEVIVFCSSDEEVLKWVKEILPELNPKPIPLVAGNPKDAISELETSGVKGFLHIKSDLLKTLTDLQKRLGIR
ncbi:putative methylmalonyl-CoA mutase, small subunit [Leptospira fainei serovar Hurstbridge str. BUT 6]|uniref:Methylmalonyl-CoA mutase, small subunit n=1 Tax=Leptospira fainei serovar Hurstbridge str. BUT 6 TaxID=1193011 RepID=S3UWJ2_9LEPT|nr:methylmalonyl-CoA mutase family protein [Leptospira fainei]EPG72729.1 putative methylmalonyl-CoA mutase, small subunit [Leptospira fainei serovar Hurstbridge str. BUT 6]